MNSTKIPLLFNSRNLLDRAKKVFFVGILSNRFRDVQKNVPFFEWVVRSLLVSRLWRLSGPVTNLRAGCCLSVLSKVATIP